MRSHRAWPLVAFRGARPHRDHVALDLHLATSGCGEEVEVPTRVLGRAALRRDQHEVVAALAEDQRELAQLAGLPALGVQHETRWRRSRGSRPRRRSPRSGRRARRRTASSRGVRRRSWVGAPPEVCSGWSWCRDRVHRMVPTSDALSFGVMSGARDSDVELPRVVADRVALGRRSRGVTQPLTRGDGRAGVAGGAHANACASAPPSCSSRLYPPAVVAKQIADLDRATGGRVTLGVGVGGEYPAEFEACGVPIGERGRAHRRGDPAAARAVVRRTVVAPRPLRSTSTACASTRRRCRVPTCRSWWRAASRWRCDAAARLGDGWMPYLYSPRRYAESVATIRETAAADGRDLTRVRVVRVRVRERRRRRRPSARARRALPRRHLHQGRLRGDDRPGRGRRHRRPGRQRRSRRSSTPAPATSCSPRWCEAMPVPLLDRLVGEVLPRLHVAAQ